MERRTQSRRETLDEAFDNLRNMAPGALQVVEGKDELARVLRALSRSFPSSTGPPS